MVEFVVNMLVILENKTHIPALYLPKLIVLASFFKKLDEKYFYILHQMKYAMHAKFNTIPTLKEEGNELKNRPFLSNRL